MKHETMRRGGVVLLAILVTGATLALRVREGAKAATAETRQERGSRQARADASWPRVYMPFLARAVALSELPVAPTVQATLPPPTVAATPTASLVPTETATPEPSATDAPTATATAVPSPTVKRPTGRITGRIIADGKPLEDGYGDDGLPQIELRLGKGDSWTKVARSIIDGGDGRFLFQDPPALGEGERYEVWWLNPPPPVGADIFLDRWRTRAITAFGDGKDVDLGSFDVADLKLQSICNDCLQTAPIEFKWGARNRPTEIYRWALFDGVSPSIEARNDAWLSESLGRKTSFITGPPSGRDFDTRYRWYVRIEDTSTGGWGWSYYAWRVTWCSSAETCR